MKAFIKKSIYTGLMMLISLRAFAENDQVEMADRLRADGKIYVLVAIILIVLVGFIAYLLLMDRKIKKLENLLTERQNKVK
jgi:hypothetical protein